MERETPIPLVRNFSERSLQSTSTQGALFLLNRRAAKREFTLFMDRKRDVNRAGDPKSVSCFLALSAKVYSCEIFKFVSFFEIFIDNEMLTVISQA